jgi:hypothetical protein
MSTSDPPNGLPLNHTWSAVERVGCNGGPLGDDATNIERHGNTVSVQGG